MRAATALGAALALLAVAPILGGLVELFEPDGFAQEVQMASGARVEGDPASDEEVRVEAEAEGEDATIVIRETPAGLVDQLPASEEIRRAHPMGPVDARMRLQAGPAVLEGPGALSPVFPLHAHVTVDEEASFDRASLRLDGKAWARLEEAGQREDRRVLLAELDAGVLPAGSTTHVDVVFDRDVGPDVIQRAEGPGWDVRADAAGPPAPELSLVDEEVRIEGEAERFEAQRRTDEDPWRPAPVEDARIRLEDDGSEGRARGVDELGNAGAWSTPLALPATNDTEPSLEPWRLISPEDGTRVAGPVAIDWRPVEDVLVEVHARGEDGEPALVGRSSQPPITWRTGFVPDGDWQLHVRALQEGNWTSRVLSLTVDNLDDAPLPGSQAAGERAPASPTIPHTRAPWSAALATGIGLLAAGGLVGRAWTRRPK